MRPDALNRPNWASSGVALALSLPEEMICTNCGGGVPTDPVGIFTGAVLFGCQSPDAAAKCSRTRSVHVKALRKAFQSVVMP